MFKGFSGGIFKKKVTELPKAGTNKTEPEEKKKMGWLANIRISPWEKDKVKNAARVKLEQPRQVNLDERLASLRKLANLQEEERRKAIQDLIKSSHIEVNKKEAFIAFMVQNFDKLENVNLVENQLSDILNLNNFLYVGAYNHWSKQPKNKDQAQINQEDFFSMLNIVLSGEISVKEGVPSSSPQIGVSQDGSSKRDPSDEVKKTAGEVLRNKASSDINKLKILLDTLKGLQDEESKKQLLNISFQDIQIEEGLEGFKEAMFDFICQYDAGNIQFMQEAMNQTSGLTLQKLMSEQFKEFLNKKNKEVGIEKSNIEPIFNQAFAIMLQGVQ